MIYDSINEIIEEHAGYNYDRNLVVLFRDKSPGRRALVIAVILCGVF